VIVIDALAGAMRSRGLTVIEQPQAAANTNTRIDLWLTGFTAGGEKGSSNPLDYEAMTFSADVVSSGVARAFVGRLRKTLRIMAELGERSLAVQVACPGQNGDIKTKKLIAHFEKISPGAFEYETEEAPMPARFKESWRITITYPADIVPQEED
jgi:hypothetical protein